MAYYPASSSNSYFAVGKQPAKGTPATTWKYGRYLSGADIEQEQKAVYEREGGDGLFVARGYKEAHEATAKLPVYARPDIAAALLAWHMGADTVSGTGPYSHAITYGSAAAWVSAERSKAGQLIERIVDSKIIGLGISCEAGKRVKIDADFLGCVPSRQTSPLTPTPESEDAFRMISGAFTVDSGANNADITGYDIKSKYDIDPVQTTALTLGDIVEVAVNIDVDIKLKWANQDLYNKVYYGGAAGTAIVEALYGGNFIADHTYGAGASQRELKLDLPNLIIAAAKVDSLDPDGKTMNLSVAAIASKVGSTSPMTATVKNSITAAYI